MIRNVLTEIGGIGMYGLVSLLLFFIVFIGVLAWVFRLNKGYMDTMKELPLNREERQSEGVNPDA